MTREEARLILGVYRCRKADATDAFFAEALKLASEDAELAKWFAAEQAFDAQITAGLAADEAPAGLKAALLTMIEPATLFRVEPRVLPRGEAWWTFPRALTLAGAAAVVAVLLTLAFTQPGGAGKERDHFRGEMVSFLLPDPSLTLKTSNLAQMQDWLRENGAAADIQVPVKTKQLPALGCRTLLFRGHKVGLLCFEREGGKIAHLLVVDRAAFARSELPSGREFKQEGEWMTATWTEHDKLYLLAAQGDREAVDPLL